MASYTTLIGTQQLESSLSDASFLIVDCRFDLKDTAAGEEAYAAGHIPGAVYAHLDRDLSAEKTGTNGRHPLPTVEISAERLGRLGVDRSVQVVVYDQDTGSFASRLWWMLRWLGHDAAAVLDGGFAKWIHERRPTHSGIETRAPRQFIAHPRPDMIATAADVASHANAKDWRLLDARAPERFRGDIEPIDKVAGHIPGAINAPFPENLNAEGTFLTPGELADRFHASLGDVRPDHAISYCGSGVTACHNVLALEHAGMKGSKLYAGSWSEWSSDPSRPVAQGDDKSGLKPDTTY